MKSPCPGMDSKFFSSEHFLLYYAAGRYNHEIQRPILLSIKRLNDLVQEIFTAEVFFIDHPKAIAVGGNFEGSGTIGF
jgi:hypothetical protein